MILILILGLTSCVKKEDENYANQTKANTVITEINQLPTTDAIELTDEVKVANVRSLYNALSKEAKALVTNLDKLEALENKLIELKKDKDNKNFFEKAAEAFSSTAQKYTKMFNQSLNNFMEATAIMIVTSCVIPILVILFFLWFIQTISGMTINTKSLTTFNPVSKVQKQFINSKE